MKDRIPAQPNRRKITYADGSFEYVTIELADTPTEAGTALNKANLLDDATAARLGLVQSDPTVNDALRDGIKLVNVKSATVQNASSLTLDLSGINMTKYLELYIYFHSTDSESRYTRVSLNGSIFTTLNTSESVETKRLYLWPYTSPVSLYFTSFGAPLSMTKMTTSATSVTSFGISTHTASTGGSPVVCDEISIIIHGVLR